ncbi:unnamed protein product, partial [Amoebophrya sp. A25]
LDLIFAACVSRGKNDHSSPCQPLKVAANNRISRVSSVTFSSELHQNAPGRKSLSKNITLRPVAIGLDGSIDSLR